MQYSINLGSKFIREYFHWGWTWGWISDNLIGAKINRGTGGHQTFCSDPRRKNSGVGKGNSRKLILVFIPSKVEFSKFIKSLL